MATRIAIIGSGPTGIYTLKGLVGSDRVLDITIFESESEPGKGTPYHPDMNDRMMLSNIASIELPAVCETLVDWLRRQTPEELATHGIERDAINEREFYPRVVIGDYLQNQFNQLIGIGTRKGHVITVKAGHRVTDIELGKDDIRVEVEQTGERRDFLFEHVVMATGHDWPETTEVKPGFYVSPWPAPILKSIPPTNVGILGTSLSGIDALVTVASKHGAFLLDSAGNLEYLPLPGTEDFRVTMMSRKGVLPEADFYCEIPYLPLDICTEEAVDHLIAHNKETLLDGLFELFKSQLVSTDPEYAGEIGLALLSVETVGPAYFRAREESDPFVWAAKNLAEAEKNKKLKRTVAWRYAILRMHEVIARAIPHLNARDLERFHKHFKSVFVDDYATVPHDSIRRLLALQRAGKLEIVALGEEGQIGNESVERGAIVTTQKGTLRFDSFIDATGQSALSAKDIPFPTLINQGVFRNAATRAPIQLLGDNDEEVVRTGGVDLDGEFRPVFQERLTNKLYCGSIAFLLHKLPFVQGITSARDIGGVISSAILASDKEITLSAA